MDKNDAIRIGRAYLNKLQEKNIAFNEAWLFGSFAKGNHNENSDIDIAIVLNDSIENSFETEINLMVVRKGEETMIEPHPFSSSDFKRNIPMVREIIDHGIRIQ